MSSCISCNLTVEYHRKHLCCLSGAFEDPDIIHVDDTVDPVRDLEIISEELRLKVCWIMHLEFLEFVVASIQLFEASKLAFCNAVFFWGIL